MFHTVQLILHLTKLDFNQLEEEHCSGTPAERYLGVALNYAFLLERHAALLQAVCQPRRGSVVTALTVLQVLGLMAAGRLVVSLGLLYMQRLQRWFASLCLDAK